MMGIKTRVFAPIEHLTFDALVPPHFCRHVEQTLDLLVRALVADCYAPGGLDLSRLSGDLETWG